MTIELIPDPTQDIVNVKLTDSVTLELVRVYRDDDGEPIPDNWEVWGVRIDGRLYREPNQALEGDTLREGPFEQWLNTAVAKEKIKIIRKTFEDHL